MKRLRMFVSLLLIAVAIGAILFVPLPASVMAVFELQPHGAESVYFEAPGILKWAVKSGEQVEKGDLLAELENIDLEMEVAQLEGEQAALKTQIETLKRMRYGEGGEQAGLELSVTREKLAATEDQLAQKLKEQQKLRLLAPIAGTVIPPLRVPERTKNNDEELDEWSGSPLDEQNRGALVSPDGPQNLLCQIGNPNQWDAVIVINQNDIVDIREGQEVRLMFDESAYHVFVSRVEFDAVVEMDVAPPRLASTSGGPLAAQPEPDGTIRPLEKSYYVLARIDDSQDMLRNGLIGRARITTEPRTIAARVGRYLARTFNFEL